MKKYTIDFTTETTRTFVWLKLNQFLVLKYKSCEQNIDMKTIHLCLAISYHKIHIIHTLH